MSHVSSQRRGSFLEKMDEKDDAQVVTVVYGSFERVQGSPRCYCPNSAHSVDFLLNQRISPCKGDHPRSSSPLFSPFLATSPRPVHHLGQALSRKPRSTRFLVLAILLFGTVALWWPEQQGQPAMQRAARQMERAGSRLKKEGCRLMPSLASCSNPFSGLKYEENAGELVFPATSLHSLPNSSARLPSHQPHPIHYLLRSAEAAWSAKVARQSTTLAQAVAEYRRRYNQAPPRGFDVWYDFAMRHNIQLIDEYDTIHRQLQPFAALSPDTLQQRSAMLQNTTGDEEFWLHKHSITLQVRGENVTAEGPMRRHNNRADQMLELLKGISQYMPNVNLTLTGHDTPWIVISGDARQYYVEAAEAGKWIDVTSFKDDWSLDGWQTICPPDSPIRSKGSFYDRSEWKAPNETTFVGLDHVKAMDVCYHPENQPLHGFTAWNGPRPGVLFPMFSFTSSALNSDLLLPPLEQYERAVGPDPAWKDKLIDKAVWRGSTTGSDLTVAHARKYSQRPRLARLPAQTGQITVPLAPNDRPGLPGPVENFTASAHDFAETYLDVKFQGFPQQCGSAEICAKLEREFEWDGFMSAETQNQYKYVIDVDGNGWSGRFHRLMASNSLVLKSTIFPEWYADRIQPWVHYVPLKVDYTDLFPILAFFKGSPYDGAGAHDALAEKIATAGRRWTEQNWRVEDMQAYLLRLVLEYARIMNRDSPGGTNWDYGASAPAMQDSAEAPGRKIR